MVNVSERHISCSFYGMRALLSTLRQGLAGLAVLLLLVAQPARALVPAPTDLMKDAVRYKNGEGVRQDYGRAYELYCLAALQTSGEAAYQLGSMHLNGWGRSANDALAAGWFEKAVQWGDTSAGMMLQDRLQGIALKADPACPVAKPDPDRAQITVWVNLLAPYYDLKPDLVLSLIQVESNFNARAKSPKNAAGLMQLMHPTAKRFGVRDRWDPIQNLQGGMAYLRWLYKHFSGNTKLVLAGYNAGEQAVKKYHGIPPYKETRLYVRRIVRIYAKYIRVRKGISESSVKYASNKYRRNNSSRMKQAKARNDRALSHGYISPSSIQ